MADEKSGYEQEEEYDNKRENRKKVGIQADKGVDSEEGEGVRCFLPRK